MRIVHIMAGLGVTSGVANVARRFVREQRERGDEAVMLAPRFKWNPIYFGFAFAWQAWWAMRNADEVWVHCSWTFPVWFGAWLAKLYGKKLVVVPEASFDPKRLHNHAGWKKRLVLPLDRWVIRNADEVYALCPDEIDWVGSFEPKANVWFVRVPFFPQIPCPSTRSSNSPLHILFLGRASDPLKGLRYLAQAIGELNKDPSVRLFPPNPHLNLRLSTSTRHSIHSPASPPQPTPQSPLLHLYTAHHPLSSSPPPTHTSFALRVVSNHTGAELEADWAWCDVLCLPTLSDNFGLVVAEAVEHGKHVITTDGAPAWDSNLCPLSLVTYLRGYRDGTDEMRIALLKRALESVARGRGNGSE